MEVFVLCIKSEELLEKFIGYLETHERYFEDSGDFSDIFNSINFVNGMLLKLNNDDGGISDEIILIYPTIIRCLAEGSSVEVALNTALVPLTIGKLVFDGYELKNGNGYIKLEKH